MKVKSNGISVCRISHKYTKIRVEKMKKKPRQKWMLLMLALMICGMLAGCGLDGGEDNRNRDLKTEEEDGGAEDREDKEEADEDGDRPKVTFKNAASWGYSGSNIWLFKDGAVVICADEGETPKGEMLEEIPKDAIRSVYVAKGVASIDKDLFTECSNLVSVEMEDVTEIGMGAFKSCSSLMSVEMPNETRIASNAFDGCPYRRIEKNERK